MFSNRWQLFRLLGTPISVDAGWLIILALLTLSLATGFPAMLYQYFPGATHEPAPAEYWVMGLVTALAFFGCILLHELGHAVVATGAACPFAALPSFCSAGWRNSGTSQRRRRRSFSWPSPGPSSASSWLAVSGSRPWWAIMPTGRIRW